MCSKNVIWLFTGSPLLAPFICIRVVTRGDYPQLVKTNVTRNMNKCVDAGLENFMIEVVTDKPINLENHRRVREIVVPPTYKTKTGALFKARALQYCLEDKINVLRWVFLVRRDSVYLRDATGTKLHTSLKRGGGSIKLWAWFNSSGVGPLRLIYIDGYIK